MHKSIEVLMNEHRLIERVLGSLETLAVQVGDGLKPERAVLAEYGNMSSPSVFFVLQSALSDTVPDGLWWMSSFGAGFSSHGAMLDVR